MLVRISERVFKFRMPFIPCGSLVYQIDEVHETLKIDEFYLGGRKLKEHWV